MSTAVDELAAALTRVLAEAVQQVAPPPSTGPLPVADLTVPQLAARLGRKPVTIRGWCEHGRFVGAYKLNGRDWRIPLSGVLAFETAQRNPVAPVTRTPPPSLKLWRQHRMGKR